MRRYWLATGVCLSICAMLVACGDEAGGSAVDAGGDAIDAGRDVGADSVADSPTDPDGGDPDGEDPDGGDPEGSDGDGADAAGEPDASANGPPAPTATAITTPANEAGTSQIAVNDPDPSDTATFEVAAAPRLGAATVSADGLVTFTPDGRGYGADALTVTVTDGSGASADVVIDITVTLYEHDGTGASFPAERCEALQGYVSLLSITPAPGSVLEAETEVELTATIWYSIGPDDELGMLLEGAFTDVAEPALTNPDEDCGTIELSATGTTTATSAPARVVFQPSSGFEVQYHVSTGDADDDVMVRFDAVSPPPGTILTDPFYTVLAEISYDLGDYGEGVGAAEVDIVDMETTGDKLYHYFFPSGPRERVPVRLFGRLSCDERATGFFVAAEPFQLSELDAFVTYPSVSPAVEVFQPFVDVAVTGVDSTVETGADGCSGPRTATLTASDDWFEPTATELVIDTDTQLGITVHGAMLTEGDVNVGTLTIAPAGGENWPAVEVPVRVLRLPFDLSESGPFTRVGFDDADRPDDSFDTIDLDGFTFPAEGAEFDQILVSSNVMIGLQRTGDTPITCASPDYYENPQGSWDAVDPAYQGCPIIAPGWCDNTLYMTRGDLEDPFPGVYYRFGTTDDVDWLEIVFWNHHMYVGDPDGYRVNSTRVVRLRADGTFSLAFPVANFGGLEMIGWAHSDGSLSDPVVPPLSIVHSDAFEFGPIPALVSD